MSDYDQALTEAQRLKTCIEAYGLTVSIELVEGRGGQGWWTPTHRGVMGHHIWSRRSQGLTPFLNLVKVGRADLTGPLCNVYLGWDKVARIICMGWANHPGAGGPYTLPAGTVPVNNGRPYFLGLEAEGGMIETEWDEDGYRPAMAGTLAGMLDYVGQPVEAHIEHKTWAPGRKVDRRGYTLDQARSEITAVMEDDMADPRFDDDVATFLNNFVANVRSVDSDSSYPRYLIPWYRRWKGTEPDDVDEADEVDALEDELAELRQRVSALEAADNDTSSGLQSGDTVQITKIGDTQ